jgi:hypothetical protein
LTPQTLDESLLGTSSIPGRMFLETSMKKAFTAFLAFILAAPLASAAAAAVDVTIPIHQFIDGFNSGDVKSAYAAYAAGNITIVDEFAPHRWLGAHAPQEWAADYNKHALATGVSDGAVKYGAATRTEIEGSLAYVIVPTIYTYLHL